mmetsp:Transcript_46978/g.130779  ORF Transcript_46978/g.130779 Transcript_46978/m.130779 type:complete len:221 (-) Transcript_46978:445-1107(-)
MRRSSSLPAAMRASRSGVIPPKSYQRLPLSDSCCFSRASKGVVATAPFFEDDDLASVEPPPDGSMKSLRSRVLRFASSRKRLSPRASRMVTKQAKACSVVCSTPRLSPRFIAAIPRPTAVSAAQSGMSLAVLAASFMLRVMPAGSAKKRCHARHAPVTALRMHVMACPLESLWSRRGLTWSMFTQSTSITTRACSKSCTACQRPSKPGLSREQSRVDCSV